MKTELMTEVENILNDAEGDPKAALAALEDGEYLGSLGLTQEEVEEIYDYIKSSIS
jgi:hypothetical protein